MSWYATPCLLHVKQPFAGQEVKIGIPVVQVYPQVIYHYGSITIGERDVALW